MNVLYQSAFFEALGWTLIDSLWQMGLLWILYVLLSANGKRFSSSFRYHIALTTMVSGSLWLIFTFINNYALAAQEQSWYNVTAFLHNYISISFSEKRIIEQAVPFAAAGYLLMVLLYGASMSFSWKKHHSLLRKSSTDVPEQIQEYLQQLCRQYPAVRRVNIWMSALVDTPLTVGFCKPIIVLPVAMINQLSMQQAEAVIAHEFFHIRRNDYLVNLFIVAIDILLFFNPFARILTGIMKKERENSCDDRVLRLGFSPWDYSQALYTLGKNQGARQVLSLGATGTANGLLLARIKRILQIAEPQPSLAKPCISFFLCLALVIFAAFKHISPTVSPATAQLNVLFYSTSLDIAQVPGRPPAANSPKESPAIKEKITPVPSNKTKQQKDGKEDQPSVPTVPENEELIGGIILHSFVNDEHLLEFSFIDPVYEDIPVPVIGELPLPYVPGSTFYCPVDSLPVPATGVIRI